jgi:hypothetical protein
LQGGLAIAGAMKLMWPYPFPAWAKVAIKRLSPTGRQCVFLLLRKYKTQEVADFFGLSRRSVEAYMGHFKRNCCKAIGEKQINRLIEKSGRPREFSLHNLRELRDPYSCRPLTV